MKALSIYQPWASAFFRCGKGMENRSWWTSFRGPVVIHASKQSAKQDEGWLACQRICEGLGIPMLSRLSVPYGALLGVVKLTGCLRIGDEKTADPWAFGPYCFQMGKPVEFKEPVPWRGSQGFFDVPDDVIKKAMAL